MGPIKRILISFVCRFTCQLIQQRVPEISTCITATERTEEIAICLGRENGIFGNCCCCVCSLKATTRAVKVVWLKVTSAPRVSSQGVRGKIIDRDTGRRAADNGSVCSGEVSKSLVNPVGEGLMCGADLIPRHHLQELCELVL